MYMSSGSHFFHFFEDLEKIHAMQYNFVNCKCKGRLIDFLAILFSCDQNKNPFWKIYDNNLFSFFVKKGLYDFSNTLIEFKQSFFIYISYYVLEITNGLEDGCARSCGALDLFLSRVTKG